MSFSVADLKSPALAGTVATITGLAASTGIVLTALTSLGASPTQVVSAFFVMLIWCGVLSIFLSWRYRMPITIVWSTPGAATIVASGAVGLSFNQAVGAFLVSGLLLMVTGFWPALGRLVSSIPKPIASAMLAGVIFKFCIAPFSSLQQFWPAVLPAIAVWFVLYKWAPVWASAAAMVVIFALSTLLQFSNKTQQLDSISNIPQLVFVTPEFDLAAILSVGIPLYIVTMAGQNIPGVAIMKSFGFDVPFKAALSTTGLASMLGTLFGGLTLNLAAISAALNADENAHKDPKKRWLASATGGVIFLALSLVAGIFVKFVLSTPTEIILAAAGLALIGTIISAISSTVELAGLRLPAMVTFLVSASGLAVFGVGSAFWALIAGLAVFGLFQNNIKNA